MPLNSSMHRAVRLGVLALSCWTRPACADAPKAIADKPLVAWSFEASDSGGPAYHTQFPQPDFVPGVVGQAWRSDGFSSWASGALALEPVRGFTVSTWIALESYPSGYEAPVDQLVPASIAQQATRDRGFDIFIDAFGRWGARISTDAGAIRLRAKGPFPLNAWVHLALTFDPPSGEACLYLSGQPVACQKHRPTTFRAAAVPFQIAHSWQQAPLGLFNINGLNAAYDEVRVDAGRLPPVAVAAAAATVTPPPAVRSLIVPASRFAGDLQRPTYHALPPANWTNEPHGLVRRGATWHMFYQRTPNGPYKTLMTWGHMRSDDLVHWTDLPLALRPELQTDDFGFDMKGIWSGDVVIGPAGFAYAFYTSVNHSAAFFNPGVSLAISDDPGLLRWTKVGPLIDRTGVQDMRDPFVWFENGEARMIVGAALGGSGGLAYYRCDNLASRRCWKRQPPMAPFAAMDVGSQIWEMPVFEKIAADRYILVANPIGGKVSKYGEPATRAVYWIGRWDGAQFTPDSVTPRMLDVVPGHLSPTVSRTADGTLVGIGIVDERRTPEAQRQAGWAHTFGLPRAWRLLPDGRSLGQSPLPALASLREPDGALVASAAGVGERRLGDLGHAVELDVRFATPPATGQYGVILAASADGREITRLYYDAEKRELVLDKSRSTLAATGEGPQVLRGAFDEAAFGKPQDFHVYVDHSVVDVFINDAAALSFRIYPTQADSTGFGMISSTETAASVKAWRLRPAPVVLDQVEAR